MAIRKILRMGNPHLRMKAAPFTPSEINSEKTKRLFQDLMDTMTVLNGSGIAAPQIGVLKRAVLIKNPIRPYKPEYFYMVNPEVKILQKKTQGYWEGCLSLPGMRGFVERPRKVQVNFYDIDGRPQWGVHKSFMATVMQHEIDHLDGVLYIDRITDFSKMGYIEEFIQYLSPQKAAKSG